MATKSTGNTLLSQLESVTPKEGTSPLRVKAFMHNVITDVVMDTNDFGSPEVRIFSGTRFIGVMPEAMVYITPQLKALDLTKPLRLIKTVERTWIATQD